MASKNKNKTDNKSNNKNNIKIKENKLKKLGVSLIESYEEPEADKTKAVKELLKKEDSPIIKKIKENRRVLIGFVFGLLIGLIVMGLLLPDRTAKTSNGEDIVVKVNDIDITADELYNDMKSHFSVSVLLDKIDNIILNKLYPYNNDIKTAVSETADYYISMYETNYGYTQEQFLSSNGFSSYEQFINYLTLDYRRTLYYTNYVKGLITDIEIKNYYDKEVFGDINTKYISINFDSKTKEESKKTIDEILLKLKEGYTYDEIITEYKDIIKYENLNYQSFNSNLDVNYLKVLKNLKDNSYTETALEDDDNYKIIFRLDQKEKKTLEEVKDTIINLIVNNKKSNDTTLKYKALKKLREENKVEFKDNDLATKYEKYLQEYSE